MSAAILAELRRGPRTTGQLAMATGSTRAAVESAIRRLKRSQHRIVNVRGRGSPHGALYVLLESRTCAEPGCVTRLSASNRSGFCGAHLSAAAAAAVRTLDEAETAVAYDHAIYIDWLIAQLERDLDGQLELAL